MLELWYKEKRTLVDFRRGPLGPYFDGFAAHLKSKGYSGSARAVLGTCCQFNAFLIERGISRPARLSESLIDSFLEEYNAEALDTSPLHTPGGAMRRSLRHLFAYLIEVKAFRPPKPKVVVRPYTWLLDPFLRHLREELELSEHTIKYRYGELVRFLDGLGQKAGRGHLKTVPAETVEKLIREFFRKSTVRPDTLSSILRPFFRYCAHHRYTKVDFSGLVPAIRRYRYASLPKGMDDSSLESMLKSIPKDTEVGARDYAIIVLMMAYGIRGISVAHLLLDDIDWHQSRIRIRAAKGGKEVLLPLLEAVGEAVVRYLRYRRVETPRREVFLCAKAPYRPLSSVLISKIVRDHLEKAGVKIPGRGSRTLRHSWAIRALANDSPIKSIADVLGHRYIDTTFIYAKANLNSLREVAMPWPGKAKT